MGGLHNLPSSSAEMTEPVESRTARVSMWVSSRALPGQRSAAPSAGQALCHRPGRWSPDEGLSCLMPVGITEASEASLAVAPLMQGSDEDREIWQVPGRDLGSGRQMIEAVGLDRPGRAAPEDLSDTSLLGAGEHGAAILVDRHHVG